MKEWKRKRSKVEPVYDEQGRKLCGAKTRRGTPCRAPAMANGRCRVHGGATPGGALSPNYKHGRYSKYLPTGLVESYQNALQDPDLVTVREELALVTARLESILSEAEIPINTWAELSDSWVTLVAAIQSGDTQKQQQAAVKINRLIQQGVNTADMWREVQELIVLRTRLAESEQRRLATLQQMITADQVMVMLGAITQAVRDAVREYAPDVAPKILTRVSQVLADITKGSDD